MSSEELLANSDIRTLLASSTGLEDAKALITRYKQGEIQAMTPELWQAKKIVDSTLHPGKFSSSTKTVFHTNEEHQTRASQSSSPSGCPAS